MLFEQRTSLLVDAAYPGSRGIIKQAFALRGIPEEALDITILSLSVSSLKQNDSAYKKWWAFCKEEHIDMFTKSIPKILSFLTIQFNNGASYGTINSYRSAIAFILGPEIG